MPELKLPVRDYQYFVETNKRLIEALIQAAEDVTRLRNELVERERINEELEQENVILRHLRKGKTG